MIEKTSFDSHPYPAGTNRLNAQVGLLTHLICCAFPVFTSGKECNKHKLPRTEAEIHSNRNCSGFAPDSLFTLRPAMWLLSSLCTANVCDIFGTTKDYFDNFCSYQAYIYDIKYMQIDDFSYEFYQTNEFIHIKNRR